MICPFEISLSKHDITLNSTFPLPVIVIQFPLKNENLCQIKFIFDTTILKFCLIVVNFKDIKSFSNFNIIEYKVLNICISIHQNLLHTMLPHETFLSIFLIILPSRNISFQKYHSFKASFSQCFNLKITLAFDSIRMYTFQYANYNQLTFYSNSTTRGFNYLARIEKSSTELFEDGVLDIYYYR